MRYIAKIMTLGKNPEIELSKDKFDEIKQAKEYLSELFAFEEKYELLLSNYQELEKECLLISSENMINSNHSYKNFFDIRLFLNQRVVNLLSTSRLYLDQVEQHIQFCSRDINVKPLFSTEYDNNFEYRFMEALRNYVQHRGLAVHSTSLDSGWTTLDDDAQMQISTTIFTSKEEVLKDRAFKRTVANEMPDKVNLIFAARSYVESISKVHCIIREQLSNIADTSRIILNKLIREYEELNDGKSLGLCLVQMNKDRGVEIALEKTYITMEWENIRLKLVKKNPSLVNLKKRYVSNNIKDNRKN